MADNPARKTMRAATSCACAHNSDGSTTTMLCPVHATEDPCATMAMVTGQRRRGSIVGGVCTNCGWSANRETARATDPAVQARRARWNHGRGPSAA